MTFLRPFSKKVKWVGRISLLGKVGSLGAKTSVKKVEMGGEYFLLLLFKWIVLEQIC